MADPEVKSLDLTEAELRAALDQRPDDLKVLRALARLLAEAGRPEAEAFAQRADRLESQVLAESAAGLQALGLGAKAQAVLGKAVALDQDNLAAAWQLVDLHRSRGSLEQAAAVLDELLCRNPSDGKAAFLHAVLCDQAAAPPVPAGRLWPVPFKRYERFLSAAQRQSLFDLVETKAPEFEASLVRRDSTPSENTAIRSSVLFTGTAGLLDWFEALLRARLKAVRAAIQVPAFPYSHAEIQVTASRGGDFYKAHRDGVPGDDAAMRSRRVSFVYYFSRRPQPFSGGQLRLFDCDLGGLHYDKARYTALEPRDNSIVFFPSDRLHEVAQVLSVSQDFLDSRFTVNGWLHCTKDHVKTLV